MYFVYILYSESFDIYYVGQTSDLEKRLFRHNQGDQNSYTSKYRPWQLYWSIEVDSRSSAMRVEKYLKKKARRFFLRLRIDKSLENYIIEKYGSG